jgi:hypothetical protein
MTIDLNIVLQICLVLLIIALTVAAVMFIIIMLDVKQITRRIKKEINAVTFLIDILDFIISGFHAAGKKIGNSKIGRNIKKTLRIINPAKGGIKEDE